MNFESVQFRDKFGREVLLRKAETEDADALIEYLRITSAETPYLIREPDEITITPEQEKAFIERKAEDERELLLVAFIDGKHIGNCSLMSIAPYRRYAHRCGIAIALYQEYCGRGIGRIMLEAVLTAAKDAGYTQAELEVIAENSRAIALYESLGFVKYGRMPGNVRYADDRFSDAYWMMKQL